MPIMWALARRAEARQETEIAEGQTMTQAWYIIECTSTKEQAACDILERMGYDETFFPRRKMNVRPRGKMARASRKGPVWEYRAWVYGYVFVCCHPADIEPYKINTVHEHRDKIRLRVVAPGGVPYQITDEDMARMKDVPARVQNLIQDAKAKERAEWEAKRPVVGVRAIITGGSFSGQFGTVMDVTDGMVKIDLGLVPVKVPEQMAERALA